MPSQNSQNLDTILQKAVAEASKNNHRQVAPSHLLLAILQTTESQAYIILDSFKVPVAEVHNIIVNKRFNQEEQGPPSGIFTAAAKICLNHARDVAGQTGNGWIRSEHLLLGLLTDTTLIKQVLKPAGVSNNKLIHQILGKIGLQPQLSGENGPTTSKEFDEICISLNKLAKDGKLDPVIGREPEIKRAHQILARRRKNNPVLIGDAGVGKTAIAEGLALSIVHQLCPPCLQDKQIYLLEVTSIVSGTIWRGQLEARVKGILDHCKKNPNIVLFIDEIHLLVGAGESVGGMDVSNMMKAALSRGDVRVIGATTEDEYNKTIAKDSALERRFQPVHVGEPSDEDTLAILEGCIGPYEKHHGVSYSKESLEMAVKLSKRYIPNRRLPDKAIDVADEAGSALKLSPSKALADLDTRIETLRQKKMAAANAEDFNQAGQLLREVRALEQQRGQILSSGGDRIVLEEHIRAAVSLISKVPLEKLTAESKRDTLNIDVRLGESIIAQRPAIKALSKYIKRGKTQLSDPKRPLGSLMLLGPTGVGKTLLAKAAAVQISGKEESLIQLDMSEYMEEHTVSRLIGSPPGYVGHDDQNTLVERVRRNPYSVVLFDEIEKAHHKVWNVLLQILEEGKLTDGQGRVASFRNTIILMTSNMGYDGIKQASLGFNPQSVDLKDKVMETVKKSFRPEFLNRLDEIIIFDSLTKADCIQILELELEKIRKRTQYDAFIISDLLKEHILQVGFSDEYGGRALKRTVEQLVTDSISDAILAEKIGEEGTLLLDWENKIVVVTQPKRALEIEPPIDFKAARSGV